MALTCMRSVRLRYQPYGGSRGPHLTSRGWTWAGARPSLAATLRSNQPAGCARLPPLTSRGWSWSGALPPLAANLLSNQPDGCARLHLLTGRGRAGSVPVSLMPTNDLSIHLIAVRAYTHLPLAAQSLVHLFPFSLSTSTATHFMQTRAATRS